ncbi:MAG: tetratricopeptide repeat protein, partial [Candidatus Magnetoovum sp. WYHC-5]|nr:tetratricopeptide repeat protein [Candidatus Magnetoovum sp. WYHC-5]
MQRQRQPLRRFYTWDTNMVSLNNFFVLLIVLFTAINVEADTSPYDDLKNGYTMLSKKEYLKAKTYLDRYLARDKLLADYALLWRATTYEHLKETDKALADIAQIKNYPSTPLIKKALTLEINILNKTAPPLVTIKAAEGYLKRYPSDDSVRYIYATLLEKTAAQKAKREFLNIYVDAGTYSKDAINHINKAALTPDEHLKRAANLTKQAKYKEAEDTLKVLLSLTDESYKNTIYNALGQCKFNQRQYKEAAEYFSNSKNLYMKARAEFRSGNYDAFESTVGALLNENNPKAYELQMIYGIHKRRNGDVKGALEVFNTLQGVTAFKEEATWNIGWSYYLTGRPKEASEFFNELYNNYGKTKYLYWTIRSLEASKGSASHLYAKMTALNDFYTVLFHLQRQIPIQKPIPPNGATNTPVNVLIKRLSVLLDYKLESAFRLEVAQFTKNAKKLKPADIIAGCELLSKASHHRYSIALAEAAAGSNTPDLNRFLYPYAFKQEVNAAANKFSTLNP